MIASFSGQYRFLSNFYHCKVFYQHKYYPTAEHAYQAAKTFDLKLRYDWEFQKVSIMHEVILNKFYGNQQLTGWLLDTHGQELVEGNNWKDDFWGVYKGKGQNMLGKIIMNIRDNVLS